MNVTTETRTRCRIVVDNSSRDHEPSALPPFTIDDVAARPIDRRPAGFRPATGAVESEACKCRPRRDLGPRKPRRTVVGNIARQDLKLFIWMNL